MKPASIKSPQLKSSQLKSSQPSPALPHLTRAQSQIHLLLEQASEAMTAQVIYQRLKAQKRSVGLATVYRSLRSLQIKGLVQARALPSGEWIYALTSEDSHYLTCLNCGMSVLLEECPVHSLEEKLGQSSNFQIFYHTLEFFGLCAPCTAGATQSSSNC
ncbi:MAG: transcriptional repressor [Cyanobacteria bacterium P01_D01_bin.105]